MGNQSETETKIAFLEKAHDDLNEVVLQQQREIERLALVVEGLRSRLQQVVEGGPAGADNPENEKPPHY